MTRGPIHKLPPNILKTARAGMNADGGGLFLNSKPTGQDWLFRFTSPATGKRREMRLQDEGSVEIGYRRLIVRDRRLL